MNIFFAFPFSEIIDKQNNTIKDEYLDYLEKSRKRILQSGHSVFLAHYREKWGKNLMSADVCTPLDYEEMKKTDFVIAYPGKKISGGVHIELGWASSLGKPIVLLLENGVNYSPLVMGLGTVTDVNIKYINDVLDTNVIDIINEYVSKRQV